MDYNSEYRLEREESEVNIHQHSVTEPEAINYLHSRERKKSP